MEHVNYVSNCHYKYARDILTLLIFDLFNQSISISIYLNCLKHSKINFLTGMVCLQINLILREKQKLYQINYNMRL